jgi:hypothetical protein
MTLPDDHECLICEMTGECGDLSYIVRDGTVGPCATCAEHGVVSAGHYLVHLVASDFGGSNIGPDEDCDLSACYACTADLFPWVLTEAATLRTIARAEVSA